MTEQAEQYEQTPIEAQSHAMTEARPNVVAARADAPITPMQMLQMAVENNAGMEQIQKFMDLADRWEANQARKAYVAAMAAFKAEPLEVRKNKHVDYTSQKGRTQYDHADLAAVVDAVVAKMSQHGLSHRWQTDQGNGAVCVTCVITHDQGHSETTTLSAAPDQSGGKNSIQAIGSTVTYLQRYTLMAATGLAARDMDNDGASADAQPPAEEQYADWFAAIDACASLDELSARKGEMLHAFGGADMTPGVLKTAYNGQRKKLQEKQ